LTTDTDTLPTVCAGVLAVIVVLLTTVTPLAAPPPIVTVAPVAKPVPVIVTAVPPVIGPDVGDTPVTVGGGTYVKEFARVAIWLSGLATLTPTRPDACAGVVAVIVAESTKVTPVAAVPPTLTVAPERKFVPLIVIAVPPAVGPDVGATLVIVGAGALTVRLNDVVCVTEPAVAVTVIVAVPRVALELAVSVRVELQVGEQLPGLNDAVTPDGIPDALSVTACDVPVVSVAVIVFGTADPRTTVLSPVLLSVKSNVGCAAAPTTSMAMMPHQSDGTV
jgi:hypothetical protein